MAYTKNPNSFDANQGKQRRAIVVDVMDPLKQGRVKLRYVGEHLQKAISDNDLPWVKPEGSPQQPGMQTMAHGPGHGLVPGSMVSCEAHDSGSSGQYVRITGTIPRDKTDGDQTMPPAAHGMTSSPRTHTEQHREQRSWGHSKGNIRRWMESKTTAEAESSRIGAAINAALTGEHVDEAYNKRTNPSWYGKQARAKDADEQSGSIGTSMFDKSKNAQKAIESLIQKKSEILKNAIPAIEQLKKVSGNPTSIQSIGAGNYSAINQQISQWYGGGADGNANKPEAISNCELLEMTANNLLTPDQLSQKKICEELHNLIDPTNANNTMIDGVALNSTSNNGSANVA
jgi:hypothetical protein